MGRGLGLHFLVKGYDVCWLTRAGARRDEFAGKLARDVRRLAKGFPGLETEGRTSVALYGDPVPRAPAVFLEAVDETREAKRAVFDQVVPGLPHECLVLSSTSSLLPGDLHPRAVVTHFFSPPELAGFVEVVWPADCPSSTKSGVRGVVRTLGLEPLEQTPETAFVATRLLMPLQCEWFRAFQAGVCRDDLEEASRSRLFPTGQASFLERVGPGTVLRSVENYLSRMTAAEASEYEPLVRGLAAWGEGGPTDGGGKRLTVPEREALRHRLLCALVNACYRLVACGQVDHRGLEFILGGFFWAEAPLSHLVEELGAAHVLHGLGEYHRTTGLSYFCPTPTLGAVSTR